MTINSLIKKLKLLGIDPKKVLGYEMDDYFHAKIREKMASF